MAGFTIFTRCEKCGGKLAVAKTVHEPMYTTRIKHCMACGHSFLTREVLAPFYEKAFAALETVSNALSDTRDNQQH